MRSVSSYIVHVLSPRIKTVLSPLSPIPQLRRTNGRQPRNSRIYSKVRKKELTVSSGRQHMNSWMPSCRAADPGNIGRADISGTPKTGTRKYANDTKVIKEVPNHCFPKSVEINQFLYVATAKVCFLQIDASQDPLIFLTYPRNVDQHTEGILRVGQRSCDMLINIPGIC